MLISNNNISPNDGDNNNNNNDITNDDFTQMTESHLLQQLFRLNSIKFHYHIRSI